MLYKDSVIRLNRFSIWKSSTLGIVVNPFLLKIYVYSDDPEVVQEAVARFEVAVISSYNERKGADFLQPPWREKRAMGNGQ